MVTVLQFRELGQIEPVEGNLILPAWIRFCQRTQIRLRLILAVFATWKNAAMEFAPSWVKTNPKRFKRVIDASGDELWSLSAHCKANLMPTKRLSLRFVTLKSVDTTEHTVIAIQIENEPGIVGSDRDYSPEGEAAFNNRCFDVDIGYTKIRRRKIIRTVAKCRQKPPAPGLRFLAGRGMPAI